MTILFTFVAFACIALILFMLAEEMVPRKYHEMVLFLDVTVVDFFTLFASAATVGIWYYTRNWVLSNMICASLGYLAVRLLNMPNFWMLALLFVCMFCFDVFWVFASEAVFTSKASFMENAANGIDIPIKFTMPYIWADGSTMIGLGDFLIPCLGMKFFRKFDVKVKDIGLHITSVIAYFIGFALCNFCMAVYDSG